MTLDRKSNICVECGLPVQEGEHLTMDDDVIPYHSECFAEKNQREQYAKELSDKMDAAGYDRYDFGGG